MAGERQSLPFDEAVEINPKVVLRRGEAYPFVDMQAVQPSSRYVFPSEQREFAGGGSRFQAGDTLMARITPCLENGKIARFADPTDKKVGHGSTEFIVVRGKQGITDNDFAYYLTRSELVRGYAISQMTGTSGRQRVPIESLGHLKVTLPPLPTQHAIAHILGTLDDKIELNRRMNATLEATARALFKSWFVDYDPVRAKAEGRQPAGMDAETAALFPEAFEDLALGQVPEGWRVVPLPEAIEVNPSRTLEKGKTAPYLDMQNMPTHGHRPVAWITRPLGSGMKFINGDTLLARITPCLENGKTAFVDFLEDGQVGWGSTEYIVFHPKPPLPVEFGYFLARSDELRAHAIQNMTGTSGRQRVPASCFDRYLIVVLPEAIAQRFSKFAKSTLAKIRTNDEQSRTLAALRDALLPKLLSGAVTVWNAKAAK